MFGNLITIFMEEIIEIFLAKKKTSCGRPLEGPLNVAVDGKAHVCCFDFNKDIIVGDLNKQSIVDVLNSKELKHIQEKQCAKVTMI